MTYCPTSPVQSSPRGVSLAATRTMTRCLGGAVAVAAIAVAGMHSAYAQPSYTVSAAVLQSEVALRFPMRYPVSGVLDLEVQAPQLHLLPGQNRINANMAIEASGPLFRRAHAGTFDVDFALRYEASDKTIRAYGLHFQNLRFPDLTPQATALLNAYGPALSKQTLQEVVLHRFSPKDLTMADNLGMQPDTITITEKGLVIGFAPKPL